MPLTKIAIARLKAHDRPYTVSDYNGLGLFVATNGTQSWHFRYRWQGKPARIVLGTYPRLCLQEARNLRDQMCLLLANGIDPRTNRRKHSTKYTGPTFAQFVPQWKTLKYRKLGFTDSSYRNSTQIQIERYLTKDMLPALGHIPLQQIIWQDVLNLLRKMEKRGAFAPAKKCQSWLGEIFKDAQMVGYMSNNPAKGIDLAALPQLAVSDYAYLTMQEMPELLNALLRYSGRTQTKLGIKLLLLTGARPGELRFAKP